MRSGAVTSGAGTVKIALGTDVLLTLSTGAVTLSGFSSAALSCCATVAMPKGYLKDPWSITKVFRHRSTNAPRPGLSLPCHKQGHTSPAACHGSSLGCDEPGSPWPIKERLWQLFHPSEPGQGPVEQPACGCTAWIRGLRMLRSLPR